MINFACFVVAICLLRSPFGTSERGKKRNFCNNKNK